MKMLLPACLSLLAALAGCSSTPAPPIEYYVLAPAVSATDSVVELANRPTVVIESVDLAAYLRQSGMIIQTGNNQLLVSRTHLWAESLELALPKALLRKLQQQSDQYSYYLKTLDWVGQTDYRLRLRVDSLQATEQGEVVAAGRYQIIPAKSPLDPVFVDFNLHRDLQQDGYAAAVAEINALLGQIAAAILASVDKLEAEAGP